MKIMTKEEIFAECDGYMTVSDESYKERFVFKEKEGQILFPFEKFPVRKESIMPGCINLMYSQKILTESEDTLKETGIK